MQIFGNGIDLREIQLITTGIGAVFIILTLVVFWNSEPITTIFTDRIIGYPVCSSTVPFIGTGFCFFPSQAEITSTIKPIFTSMDSIIHLNLNSALIDFVVKLPLNLVLYIWIICRLLVGLGFLSLVIGTYFKIMYGLYNIVNTA